MLLRWVKSFQKSGSIFIKKNIHGTTKQRPVDMFKEEKQYLRAFYNAPLREDRLMQENQKDIVNIKENITIPNIDISYHTTISDYECILGGVYATS